MFFVNRSRVIARYAKGRVLDVGFGDGNPYLKNVIGIEISKHKKPKNYDSIKIMDAQNMTFKNDSFNSITVGCVLAHLENPSKFLRECYRVLTKDGRLILTVPNPISPLTAFSNLFFPTHPSTASQHISVIPPEI